MVFKSFGLLVNGIHTDIAHSSFEDNNLVIISQYKKIGEIFLVKRSIFHSLEGQEELYSVQSLLGNGEDKTLGAVRFLAERLKISRNTVFCVTLKDFTPQNLRAIADALEKKVSL